MMRTSVQRLRKRLKPRASLAYACLVRRGVIRFTALFVFRFHAVGFALLHYDGSALAYAGTFAHKYLE
jgi:hypothetical protein